MKEHCFLLLLLCAWLRLNSGQDHNWGKVVPCYVVQGQVVCPQCNSRAGLVCPRPVPPENKCTTQTPTEPTTSSITTAPSTTHQFIPIVVRVRPEPSNNTEDKLDQSSNITEDGLDQINEDSLDQINDDSPDLINEDSLNRVTEDSLDQITKDRLDQIKEDSLDQIKEDSLDQINEDSLDQINEDSLDQIKEDSLDQSNEDSLDQDTKDTLDPRFNKPPVDMKIYLYRILGAFKPKRAKREVIECRWNGDCPCPLICCRDGEGRPMVCKKGIKLRKPFGKK